jgi:pimeloyl-ACP methyl ester carboxylesterase
VALELAQIRSLATLTLLSPAGLWRGRTPLYCRARLKAARWLAKHTTDVLSRLVNYRLGRALILGQTHGRPFCITPNYARTVVRTMGTCPGFDATFKATIPRCYQSVPAIDSPVTVAFGSRDLLTLPFQSRHLDELPPSTRRGKLPRCGHVPMADNPDAVTALVTASTTRGTVHLTTDLGSWTGQWAAG